MRVNKLLFFALVLSTPLASVACKSDPVQSVLAPAPPGLEAAPRWMTFTCIRPGCETTLTATVAVVGSRGLAIKRVVLSDRSRSDVSVTASKMPPFVLEPGEVFTVSATYVPNGDPRLGDVDVLVTYTDGSVSESDDRVEAGELEVPIVRRLIGEPVLSVEQSVLDFGAVLPGASKTMKLRVGNRGFGNVGVVVESASSDVPEISVGAMPANAILPGTTAELDVTFSPLDEAYSAGFLEVWSADPRAAPAVVAIRATSIPHGQLLVTPEAGFDFGEVPVGGTASGRFEITNQGAETMLVDAIELLGPSAPSLEMRLPRGEFPMPLGSLKSLTATLTLSADVAGPVDARVVVHGIGTTSQTVELPVVGLVTQPNAVVAPELVDFGGVPRGWVSTRSVEIINSGYGELVVTNARLVAGSSQLFTLRTVPVPLSLRHDQRVAIEVEFRAETEAMFEGIIAIDTNDPETPFLEVPIRASGVSCEAGCPIAHGTPTCIDGTCAIASCDAGYYDTDMSPQSGCECADLGGDPGAFCTEAQDLGTVPDDGARRTYSGVLAAADDEDLIRFFGQDESQFLDDDFDVRVRLETSDPGIEMCVYRHDTGNHESACFFDNEECTTSYRRNGSWPGDDSADFSIKLRRRPGAAPACSSYTIFVSNG